MKCSLKALQKKLIGVKLGNYGTVDSVLCGNCGHHLCLKAKSCVEADKMMYMVAMSNGFRYRLITVQEFIIKYFKK